MKKKAIVIGAGPAGLTAAYEMLKRTDILPIILEKSGDIGGISKTVNYKGNRIDIGGHRFFSKSDRVMEWWLNIMPIQPQPEKQFTVTYHRHHKTLKAEEPINGHDTTTISDKVMLVRRRLSRIYFLRKFFAYPIQLSLDTLRKLGLPRTIGILVSYVKARLFPRKPEKSLEDFFINRFGDKLYRLFFKDYTEKVWGVACTKISAEWGAQRIKGISIAKAIEHAVKSLKPKKNTDIGQKGTETSLIEQFLYPKFGPGQLWEEVARQVKEMGGRILMHHEVRAILSEDSTITAIETFNTQTDETTVLEGDYFFSTMPIQELITGMNGAVPENVRQVAAGLQYRDFITVGVLLKKMSMAGGEAGNENQRVLPDTWIYIQERDVKVGRLQIFNNWSPFMVRDPGTAWLGMEYFCNKEDDFWKLSDSEIKSLAIGELVKIGLADIADVLDSTVLRMEKTYPAYFGTYARFEEIKQFTNSFPNLFLVGRNGMHKYNNSDHSMLTAMVAVDNIAAGITTKDNIWSINTEQEYHEEKAPENPAPEGIPGQSIPGYQPTQKGGSLLPSPAGASILPSFKEYLFKDRRNKWYLWFAAIAIILQFVLFKYFYPQAGFISGDSYVYLDTAYWNYSINTYPIGYSCFLRIFSTFSTSDTALVAFQYLLMQCSALYFLFTFFFLYKPGKIIQVLLLGFFVLNPFFLYMSNYILSDALFMPLSIVWFTLLLWILHRPTILLIFIQALVLFVAFTVRYNALFYPIIGSIALLFSRQRVWMKIGGIVGSVLLIAVFIWHTSNRYYKLTGIRQFSPFSGWQIANNAMYAYRYVDNQYVKPVPPRFRELDKMIRTYFDTTRDIKKHPESMLVASTVYMWSPASPLQNYMIDQFKNDSTPINTAVILKRWATVAPLYADYGNWLIRQYPLQFSKYYLWPNALKYYAPPVEFLDTYNMGIDSVTEIAQTWFHYKQSKVKTFFKDFKVTNLNFYPILVGTLNVIFLVSFIFFLLLNGLRDEPGLRQALLLAVSLWLVNFGFSIYASPIALRFQMFPVFIFLSFALLLLEYIAKAAFSKESILTEPVKKQII